MLGKLRFSVVLIVSGAFAGLLGVGLACATQPAEQVTKPGDLLKEADGLELRFGYYPSADRIRLLILRAPNAFTRWEARLSKPPSKATVRQWEGPLPFPKAGITLDAPALGDGTYVLAVALISKDGTRREIHRTFERKRFPWEDSPAGRDRVIIPPFTPLQVDEEGRTVSGGGRSGCPPP